MDRGSQEAGVARIAELAERYGLPPSAIRRLDLLLDLLVHDPSAPTAIRDRGKALDDHLADALVALELPRLRDATAAVDIGSGAGLPGLALAIALPETRFALLESSARKCAFLERAVAVSEVPNAVVVHARAESWSEGIGRHDLVTARAVAALDVVAEYAAPLLETGGTLVAWRGRRDPQAEAAAARAAEQLGLGPPEVRVVRPYQAAEHRHLYLMSKLTETPSGFPRRPGMALKRPLGRRGSSKVTTSDRASR
jgi:16S rRNA (guanine527-N7)-methyltransferase